MFSGGRTLSRRSFLRFGAAAAWSQAISRSLGPSFLATAGSERALSLSNARTGETVNLTYWQRGRLVPSSLEIIRHLMRDNHSDRARDIDLRLVDVLFRVARRLGTMEPFTILSGYRTPETNSWLGQIGFEVAPNSLHMHGRAVDVRLPRTPLLSLYQAAVAVQGGGVGYYPHGYFVHVDVGPVRSWNGPSTGIILPPPVTLTPASPASSGAPGGIAGLAGRSGL